MAEWKKWAGRACLVIIPPLFFLVSLEVACRALGWGYPTSFLVPDRIGGKDVWRTNEFYGYRFFQPLMARSPAPIVIDRKKPAGVKRIAVLGESAAMGDPLIEFSLARALDKILNKPGEQRRYEVINAGVTAISSLVIADIAEELASKGVDIFVVYAGNNEVVGPYGPVTVFQRGLLGRWFAPWHARWTRTRLASSAQAWQSASSPGQPWDGMAMFSKNRLPPSSPLTEQVYRAYEENLERIADSAEKHGVKTILCTVAVNLKDCPPFGSAHGRILTEEATTAWQAAFESGKSAAAAGRHTDAVEAFTEALRIDPDHAEANYLAAVSAEKSGDGTNAVQLYVRARDLDTLRVRTDSRMNELVRSVAVKRGTKFIECDEVLGAAPGAESFVDHVHFTLEAVALLANAVAVAIDDDSAPLNVETLAERLDYNDWSRSKLATIMLQRLENPPFVEQAGNKERAEQWRSQRETLRSVLNSTDAESILTDLGEHQDAYPWDSDYAVQSLHRLAGIGAWQEAALLADEICPKLYGSSPVNGLAALVYTRSGRTEEAATVLTMGGQPFGYFLTDAAFQLFGALTEMGEQSTAVAVADHVLAQAPVFPGRAAIVRWRDQAAL